MEFLIVILISIVLYNTISKKKTSNINALRGITKLYC